jgi:predicted ATPase
MTLERSNFFVITGCSGGGKSTLIDALRRGGFLCVDEVGRRIVRQQLRIGGDATPWQDQIKFRELLLARYMDVFEEVVERTSPVFFDRGIPEAIGWSRLLNVRTLEHHRAAARICRYARKVFVTPPWPEIFRQDEERRHSLKMRWRSTHWRWRSTSGADMSWSKFRNCRFPRELISSWRRLVCNPEDRLVTLPVRPQTPAMKSLGSRAQAGKAQAQRLAEPEGVDRVIVVGITGIRMHQN